MQILTHISPGITRADTVFTDIRQRIVEGNILTGSKLSEPGLAKYYEISRSTLRDALSRLEGCGLLERKANIGYRVVTLSTEQLLEVFRVRESLEGMACRLAAKNMTSIQITDLKKLLDVHNQYESLKQGQAYIQEEGD